MVLNMNRLILIVFVLHLAGCATAKQVMTPDGKPGYSITCNGTAVSMTVCYEKAAEVCPKGYSVVDKQNQSGFVVSKNYMGSTSNKGIFVECK